MAIGQIGKNTAEEFFETILYMTAYEESKTIIKGFTKDIENPVIQEAVESAMNVAVFGLIFLAVQKQEQIISLIFEKTEAVFLLLIQNPMRRALSKMRNMRGIKLLRKLGFFQANNMENIGTAQAIAIHQSGKASSYGVINAKDKRMDTYTAVNETKNTLYNREKLHMDMGNNMAQRYNGTLLFKLFTKSFTANDEMLIKKIIGRDTATALSIDDMNKVANFLYTTDTTGKVTGLSEAFMDLINGLGYLHNK